MKVDSILENIQRAREEAGLTQEQMSKILGMSRQTYNHLETGKTEIISKQIFKIAKSLGISEEKLLLGYEIDYDIESMSKALHEKTLALDYAKKEMSGMKIRMKDMEDIVSTQRDHISTLKLINKYLSEQTGEIDADSSE